MLTELETPLAAKDIRGLKLGDRLSLSGTVFTMRDQASLRLLRILRECDEPPVDITGGVIYHAGPAVDMYKAHPKIISIGPTTSARMNSIMPQLIELSEVRLIVGKGGMDDKVLSALARFGCAYASAIGGCAALYTRSVKGIRKIVWKEMGPEAIYELEVERMRPLTVTMDTHDGSLHHEIEMGAVRKLKQLLAGNP